MTDEDPIEIPVRHISGRGQPLLIGRAIFDDTKHMRVEFMDHEFVEEFYDLKDHEMIMTISFNPKDKDEKLLSFLADRSNIKLSDI